VLLRSSLDCSAAVALVEIGRARLSDYGINIVGRGEAVGGLPVAPVLGVVLALDDFEK